MKVPSRPLSPHLGIYRWPITMVLSILHRMTGVALSVGLAVLCVWLTSVAFYVLPYSSLYRVFDSIVGQLFLVAMSFAFFLHLANGVRHLIWDTGRLMEKTQADLSAWFVIVSAVVLTAVYWLLLL